MHKCLFILYYIFGEKLWIMDLTASSIQILFWVEEMERHFAQ